MLAGNGNADAALAPPAATSTPASDALTTVLVAEVLRSLESL